MPNPDGAALTVVYAGVQTATADARFPAVAQHMFDLMMRNVASDGFVFAEPGTGFQSRPGAILASPSYPANLDIVDQNYVYNWTRDAAITAMEIAAAVQPADLGANQTLADYVTFAQTCQNASGAPLDRGCYRIDGTPRDWSDQGDGPALRILAVQRALPHLDAQATETAAEVVEKDLAYLLSHYQLPTTNLWEEHRGHSFFTRAVQLRCFEEMRRTAVTAARRDELDAARRWLSDALSQHWDGTIYRSMLDADTGEGYEPNIDIVMAGVYGAIPCTDTRLLATAAALRAVWADPDSPLFYPVNAQDAEAGRGPLFGRYPQDHYDGDTQDPDSVGGHPWPLCTSVVAELYYRVATSVETDKRLALDELSTVYFAQIGIDATTPLAQATALLRNAGDRLLEAVIAHSDHLELSEQYDGATGYEKSVRDLTWSYAAFLSAARAKTGEAVRF